jgi:hypothetical protein
MRAYNSVKMAKQLASPPPGESEPSRSSDRLQWWAHEPKYLHVLVHGGALVHTDILPNLSSFSNM